VAYSLFHWYGDTVSPRKYWKGLTRFIDNEYSRTHQSSTPDVKRIFAGPGDWCPAPKAAANPDFKPEARVNPEYSAGFSFINDVGHMAEMAAFLGVDAEKYANMYTEMKGLFHAAWYNKTTEVYADGGQTAQALALQLDCMPTAAIKNKVLGHLVDNIVNGHDNHTTSGIIGWRFVLDVLSANGHSDVAHAMMTQTSYPSFGYQILNKVSMLDLE
jgi:alpha-L-rhamnosidase